MRTTGNNGTRKAILSAAAKMFAARGFRAATVRDICAEAGANIALVSRYFGSKRELYAEVCRSLFNGLAVPLAKLDQGITTAKGCRDAIREWIHRAIRIMSATRSPAREAAGIFRHEMTEPSSMHEYIKREFLEPTFNCFRRLVEICGSDSEATTLSILSAVWSQMSIYALLADVWQKPFRPAAIPRAQWIDRIAGDIADCVFARLPQ